MGFGNGFGDSFACVTLSSSCSVNTWPRTEPSSPFSPACGYAASTPKVRPVRRGLTATVPSSQCRRKYRWTWGFTVLTVQVPIVCSSAPAPCPAPCWWRPRGTRPALTNQLPPPSAPRCHEDRHPMSLPRAMCHSQRNASPGVTASDRSVCIRVCRALCSPPMVGSCRESQGRPGSSQHPPLRPLGHAAEPGPEALDTSPWARLVGLKCSSFSQARCLMV
ncbi:uncharacterized protein LOC125132382 isoform X1 [Phacochoerus africanus]|uniref:uncharacterized protein LOC125132382 isoform X1 n=1 Tax=Phacochoerus africanus TaxID=41426 RepID=UPI001FD985A5|nr:uncharacterized protein LOC125132382 isoform X1 [Phacochoerus africanus]